MKDGPREQPTEGEVRCGCGSLMARLTRGGLELKCRRCKRLVVVPVDRERDEWVEVPMR